MRINLQLRAAISVCAAVLSIVICKSLFDLNSGNMERAAAMAGRLGAITTMQGDALAHPLWDFNLDQMNSIIGTLTEESAFVSATIYGPDQKIIAQRLAPHGISDKPSDPQVWTFDVPIVFKEGPHTEKLGRLRAVFSKSALRVALSNDIVRSLEALAVVAIVTIAAVLICLRLIARQLQTLFGAMERIVSGDLSTSVPGLGRADEIGAIANAIALFKEAAVQKHKLEEQSHTNSLKQAAVVDALALGLAQLASGNLTCALDHELGADYERLITDFNSAVAQLRAAMGMITDNTNAISAGSHDITVAADDLCLRTERHAASLEETSSSMNVLACNVKQTSAGASQARCLVSEVKNQAEHSSTVVTHAIEAMGRIKNASHQITQMVRVIDGLTARTNLLALNAAIEAARAGTAGLGFSVVATEVRALAQQCSEAADKIKSLVAVSTVEVENGVTLVGETGAALAKISGMIAQVDDVVKTISEASRDQAHGLEEINVAVGEMDDVTQKNASMIKEVTDSAHGLDREMKSLSDMVGRFKIGAPKQEVRDPHLAMDVVPSKPGERKRTVTAMSIVSQELRAS